MSILLFAFLNWLVFLPLFPGNGTQAIAWAINAETERKRRELEAEAASGMSSTHQTAPYPPDPHPPPNGTALSATSMGTCVPKPIPTPARPGLRIFYASAHDILSYPCEDGNPELVRDASVSLPHGSHGQWIENVHLETYESEREFWVGRGAGDEGVYERTFGKLLRSAEGFVRRTRSGKTPGEHAQGQTQASEGEDEDDVMIFVSCGFDASEYEYPSMSRHGRHVPASFYYRFARDVRGLADRHTRGRVVSVLEGGYSDRALIAGGLAWVTGLAGYEPPDDKNKLGALSLSEKEEEAVETKPFTGRLDDAAGMKEWIPGTGPRDWWALGNMDKLEKAAKKHTQRRGKTSLGGSDDSPWLERTLQVFGLIEGLAAGPSSHHHRANQSVAPSSTMTLRRQKKPGLSVPTSSATASATASATTGENKRRRSSSCDASAATTTTVAEWNPLESAAPTRGGAQRQADKGPGTADHNDSRTRHTASRPDVGSSSEHKGRGMNATQQLQSHHQVDTSSNAIGPRHIVSVSGAASRSTASANSSTAARPLPKIILKVNPPS